jgi:hypothetical protein
MLGLSRHDAGISRYRPAALSFTGRPPRLPLAYERRETRRADVTHRKDKAEEQAIALLQRVVAMSEADRDALPGSAVKHVKLAIAIMRKRRRQEAPAAGRPNPSDA